MLGVIKGRQGRHGDSRVSEWEGRGEEVGGIVGTCGFDSEWVGATEGL